MPNSTSEHENTPLQDSSQQEHSMAAFAGETKFHVGLLVLWRNPTIADFPSVVYLKAAGEGLFLTLLISWIITFIFRPDVITENPLKTRLGYNNLCVGWDVPPADYVASILWIPIAYLALRFVYINDVRFRLQQAIDGVPMSRCSAYSNYSFGVAVAVFTLVLVISPFKSVWLHSIPFMLYIVTRFLAIWTLCLEDWIEMRGYSKVFLYVYGFISFTLPMIYICEYTYYDIHGVKSPWPWQITFVMDYGWFACLALTSKFIPSNLLMHRVFELVDINEREAEKYRARGDTRITTEDIP